MSKIKDPWELPLMRRSGALLAEVAECMKEAIRPGVSGLELDEIAARETARRGCVSAFKGYAPAGHRPYPATICLSINEQVVHGIPGARALVDGDLVSIDMGLSHAGYFADLAFSLVIGSNSEAEALVRVTQGALDAALIQCVAGNRIGDVGSAVEVVVLPLGYGIVRDYVGHGIGRAMHESPSVPNYGKSGRGEILREGMCLAIEPMITRGRDETRVLRDGWTVVTVDRSNAAHFEHTIVVTTRGAEILTRL